jgi:hypothetical protein
MAARPGVCDAKGLTVCTEVPVRPDTLVTVIDRELIRAVAANASRVYEIQIPAAEEKERLERWAFSVLNAARRRKPL